MIKYGLILVSAFMLAAGFEVQAQVKVQVWTSNGDNKIQQLAEGNTSDLISTDAVTPWGLAVDPVAGKLYWSNVTEGTINSADIDGGNAEMILSGLDLPRGIALDETTNTLFWAEAGVLNPGIRRVNLNESSLVVTDVVTSGVVSPYHIIVDAGGEYVYWADNASSVKQINRIKYDGSGLETIITDVYVKQFAGLALDASANKLYWSDFEDDVIYSSDAVGEDQNVQVIYEISDESTPWAMDLDSESETLYWTDYLNSSIYSLGLSTSESTEIVSGISTPSSITGYTDHVITPGSPDNFVTTWISNNDGKSADDEITIPTHPGSTYNYDVYWEDVNDPARNDTLENSSGNLTIDFEVPGTYRIEIAGTFPRILFFDPNASDGSQSIDPLKIITIEQWGAIEWGSMEHAFRGASNLTLSATDAPNLSAVDNLGSTFFGASSFTLDGDGTLNNWDVSTISIFNEMFSGATDFNGDLSDWETTNAEQMKGVFHNSLVFNSDLSGWDVSNVENFEGMFSHAEAFNSDISIWMTSSATTMNQMFRNAISFNHNLGEWDIGEVTTMEEMLNNSGLSVENYDKALIGWNAQSVQLNVVLDADGLQYCQGDGADARQALIDNDFWAITDSGPADNCVPTGLEGNGDVPANVSLKQNYPNPFNPATLISFDLPAAGQVRIVIYDMMGRSVMTLVDKPFSAGSHQVRLDAGRLSSGVYLYSLEASGMTATRKMMLVK